MKFPRIPHLPFSPGGTNDDKRLSSIDHLSGHSLVLTEKLDGSNLCMTRDDVFARSHSGPPTHPSFDMAKALHAQIRDRIPSDIMLFGEWCYAVHSIEYNELPDYFFLFAVYMPEEDGNPGGWVFWDGVEKWAKTLGLVTVPVLSIKEASQAVLQKLIEFHANEPSRYGPTREGVVVRTNRGFYDDEFPLCIAKWVRADHVQTDDHWRHQEIKKQKLK